VHGCKILGREKNFGVIYRGILEVHPQAEEKSFLKEIFAGRERVGVVNSSFSLHIEGDDYKKVVNFLRKKCIPEKILSTPMRVNIHVGVIGAFTCCVLQASR